MKEKSTPLNFTVNDLEKPLKQKKVTAAIRNLSFIRRFALDIGTKIEVKCHRKRVGFAVITDIRFINYYDLFDPEVIRNLGFDSTHDLINALKPYWRWQWNRIISREMKMPLIEFNWI